MSNEKVVVYSTNKSFEAESLKEYLASNGIIAFILNKMDSAYLFGDVEILVDKDDVIQAKKLIEEYFGHE